LFYLLSPLRENFIVFNLLRYITFRSAYAAVTSLLISLIFGKQLILFLKSRALTESISKWIKDTHGQKGGTPTMGGVLIIISLLVSVLLWADIRNPFILYLIGITVWMGVFGIFDDYIKGKRGDGFNVFTKIIIQIIPAVFIGIMFVIFPIKSGYETLTIAPFFKNVFINLGFFYIPFIILVIIGTTNAVNITDGMDGLAIGLSSIIAIAFAFIAYITGNIKFAEYLNLLYIPGSGEVAVFCAAFVGSSIGFLWFNSHPAEIFMGDTGSLAIGGILGLIAILLKHEFLLLVIGGVFVMEALSVLLQVASFKCTGRRIFKMAPLHHHFHLMGWQESKVVIRFWIWGIMFALIGLSTLKIR
jgi:phospho-N-acetylmuramoyl-pentapeptide-transferase